MNGRSYLLKQFGVIPIAKRELLLAQDIPITTRELLLAQ